MSYTVIPDKPTAEVFFEANWDTSIKDNMNTGIWRPLGDTVLSANAASITFSGIPGTLIHLALIVHARTDGAFNATELRAQFNGDTGNNYDYQQMLGQGNAPVAAEGLAQSGVLVGAQPAASAVANSFGSSAAFIPNYVNTANNLSLVAMAQFCYATSSTGCDVRFVSGHWRNNSAVTSILLLSGSADNFIAGTRATLYGLGNV